MEEFPGIPATETSGDAPAEIVFVPGDKRQLRIVVVNDEAFALEMSDMILRDWFKEVTLLMYANGLEALRELSQADPDLLITDDRMPIMCGSELCERLLDKKVTYPIIVNSAWGPTEQWVRELASRGLNVTFLPVPYEIACLRDRVEAALNIRPKKARAESPKSPVPEDVDTESDHNGATHNESEMRLMPVWFGSRQSATYTHAEIKRWLQLRAIEWSGWPAFITQPLIPLLLTAFPALPVLLTLLAAETLWPFVSLFCINLPLVKLSPLLATFLKWPSAIGCGVFLFMHHRPGVAVLALLWPVLAAFASAPATLLTVRLRLPGQIAVIERVLAQRIGYLH